MEDVTQKDCYCQTDWNDLFPKEKILHLKPSLWKTNGIDILKKYLFYTEMHKEVCCSKVF